MDTLSRVVRWLNEKSQIQALHRTQPGLPLNKGRAGTMTHDYIGNGTTTLIAAMSIVDGAVIGRNVHRHRHQEFVCLLNGIGDKGPPAKILDTYAARKQPKVLQALDLRSALVARSSPNVDLFLRRGPIVDMPVEAPSAQNADFDLDRGCHCRCADTRSRSAPRSYVDMTRLFRRLNSDRSNFVGTLLPALQLSAPWAGSLRRSDEGLLVAVVLSSTCMGQFRWKP
jgi:hypothetical protein